MARDNYFKSKRAPLSKRQSETREPKPSAILIVTEGTETEPLYLNGIQRYITQKYGKNIDVRTPKIDIHGEGLGTTSLVREAASIVNHARRIYSQCWVVFDRDDFQDFDEAIRLAEKYGFQVAWSNSCFEFWMMLHFRKDMTPRESDGWKDSLGAELKKAGLIKSRYEKNDACIAKLPLIDGALKRAVENARSIEKQQSSSIPSRQNPGTTVHHLIESLSPYLGDILEAK